MYISEVQVPALAHYDTMNTKLHKPTILNTTTCTRYQVNAKCNFYCFQWLHDSHVVVGSVVNQWSIKALWYPPMVCIHVGGSNTRYEAQYSKAIEVIIAKQHTFLGCHKVYHGNMC